MNMKNQKTRILLLAGLTAVLVSILLGHIITIILTPLTAGLWNTPIEIVMAITCGSLIGWVLKRKCGIQQGYVIAITSLFYAYAATLLLRPASLLSPLIGTIIYIFLMPVLFVLFEKYFSSKRVSQRVKLAIVTIGFLPFYLFCALFGLYLTRLVAFYVYPY